MLKITCTVSPKLSDYHVSPEQIAACNKGAANNILRLVKENFLSLGGRYYWGNAAKSTLTQADDKSASVSVYQRGVRLRWQGGTVQAGASISSHTGRPTKYLAIPASDDITEHPGFYAGLKFIPINKGKLGGILATLDDKGKVSKKFFSLVSSTTHQPNPAVMPPAQAMQAELSKAAGSTIQIFKLTKK